MYSQIKNSKSNFPKISPNEHHSLSCPRSYFPPNLLQYFSSFCPFSFFLIFLKGGIQYNPKNSKWLENKHVSSSIQTIPFLSEEDEDVPYIFDEMEEPETKRVDIGSKTTGIEQKVEFEYKTNFYNAIKETSDYLENMIDNLFLEKQTKYLNELLNEKSFNINYMKETPRTPVSQNMDFPPQNGESEDNQENRENVDPITFLVPKTTKTELRNSNERKIAPIEAIEEKNIKNESAKKEKEDHPKKDKSSLLVRIQNSLKDLTSVTNEKTFHQSSQKPKEEKSEASYLESTPQLKEDRLTESLDLKAKLSQASSILNLKLPNVKSIFLQNKRKPTTHDIRSLLTVSKSAIKYGNVLPGYIMEDDLEIQNKSNQSLSVKVCVLCHNSELDDHDEYVYSVRKLNIYDYNEKIISVLPPHNTLKYKVALKVPNLKSASELQGSVVITVQGVESNITLPVISAVDIPEIFCPKEIYDKNNNCSIIKFALKKGKKQDCKIPFKNNSRYNVTMEFEFIEPQEKKIGYDILTYPSVVSLAANGFGILNVILKPTINALPALENNNDKEIRRVLLAKIKNSSMIYYFPLSIEIY